MLFKKVFCILRDILADRLSLFGNESRLDTFLNIDLMINSLTRHAHPSFFLFCIIASNICLHRRLYLTKIKYLDYVDLCFPPLTLDLYETIAFSWE